MKILDLINKKSIYLLGLFFCLIFHKSFAQQTEKPAPVESKVVTVQTVKDYMKKLGTDPNFQYAQIGFSLKSVATGKTLLDVNGGKSLMVAGYDFISR